MYLSFLNKYSFEIYKKKRIGLIRVTIVIGNQELSVM